MRTYHLFPPQNEEQLLFRCHLRSLLKNYPLHQVADYCALPIWYLKYYYFSIKRKPRTFLSAIKYYWKRHPQMVERIAEHDDKIKKLLLKKVKRTYSRQAGLTRSCIEDIVEE